MEAPAPKLLPGERLVTVEQLTLVKPALMPDALAELCKLTGVEHPELIGTNGPSVASRASEENAGSSTGLHLFEVVFGRDSLLVALILADLYPLLLEATVRHLAAFQGTHTDDRSEMEPGRIAHEIRDLATDPVAQALAAPAGHPAGYGGWGWPYYGSVDATALFILALCRAAKRRPALLAELVTRADGSVVTLADSLEEAGDWLLGRIEPDELGLLCYRRANPHGLENQVWKDSWDSVFHADGEIANHLAPVATIELQALAYDALLDLGSVSDAFGSRREHAAARLAAAVEEHFWVPDSEGGFYAIGVDRDPASGLPRTCAVRSSNMGWLLRSRLLDGQGFVSRRRRIVQLLTAPEFLFPAGISTLSSREIRYRPRAYHSGNVWLFDNYLIANGFRRHGFLGEAREVERRIIADCLATHRLPEYVASSGPLIADRIVDVQDEQVGKGNRIEQVGKGNRIEQVGKGNRIEQPPQEIQAWTVAAVVAIEARQAAMRSF